MKLLCKRCKYCRPFSCFNVNKGYHYCVHKNRSVSVWTAIEACPDYEGTYIDGKDILLAVITGVITGVGIYLWTTL